VNGAKQNTSAPTSNLVAQPTTINSGQSTILTWSSQNGTTVDLQPGVGTVPAQGTATVTPKQTTTYTLTVTGTGGTSTVSATVTVSAATQTAGVPLSPGDDIQTAVNSNPTGTTFTLAPGVYRMQSLVPKEGDVFSGQKGATLVGAALIDASSWTQASSGVWVVPVSGITPESSYRGECDATHPACMYPEDMFFDSKPFTRVASLSLVAPGKWFLDYGTDKAYVGSDPSGHTVEISIDRAAFWGSASNVTIRGLTIEKYASIAGKGAINALDSLDGYGPAANNWTVDSNELLLNHGAAIRVNNGMVVENNKIHDNGQLGIGGNGDQIVVENNEVYNNNYAGYSFDWEAGGIKVASSATHVTIEGNYVHDNNGPGIHADISCDYVTIENNHTAHNLAIGIHYELSYNGVIKNNLVEDDGTLIPGSTGPWYGGGIIVSNSENVEVSGNTVTDCSNGICGTYADRGSDATTGLPYTLKNLNVHNNTITQQTGFAAGIVRASAFDDSVYTSWGNHFTDNNFNLSDLTYQYFYWLVQSWTDAQWLTYAAEH
jgi:parallel beta-helix repeat protein